MAIICPTVTATNNTDYQESILRVAEFAERIHIDFADGDFSPVKLVPIDDVWWPVGPVIDFHVMYRRPMEQIERIIAQQPSLVVIHAEAEDAKVFLKELSGMGIRRGVALLQGTSISVVQPYIDELDHVLVFSGDLGHYGGVADLKLLDKVRDLKAIKPELEIGWDGGISDQNVRDLVLGGVDVLNVGGFIQKSTDPEDAYDTLLMKVQ